MGCWTDRRLAVVRLPVDVLCHNQQHLVVYRRYPPTGGKPDAAAAGDQLQLQAQSERLPYFLAHHHGELAGERTRALDGARVFGHGSTREIRLAGDQPTSDRLLQCSRAPRHRCLDAGDGAAISVSEMRGTLVQFQNLIAIVKISGVITPTPRGRRNKDKRDLRAHVCESYIKEIP